MERYFEVRGKVQNVMFRQTIIRAMIKRGLEGGASNDRRDKTLVHLTLRGGNDAIEELVDVLQKNTLLNDWGAKATTVKEVETDQAYQQPHQVTTENVDSKNWNPNVTMFI